jgi:hypothetical protein
MTAKAKVDSFGEGAFVQPGASCDDRRVTGASPGREPRSGVPGPVGPPAAVGRDDLAHDEAGPVGGEQQDHVGVGRREAHPPDHGRDEGPAAAQHVAEVHGVEAVPVVLVAVQKRE